MTSTPATPATPAGPAVTAPAGIAAGTEQVDHHRTAEATVLRWGACLDARDWVGVRDVLDGSVLLDYSSLTGAPAETLDADAVVAGWRATLPDGFATQHLIVGVLVELGEDARSASLSAQVVSRRHRRPVEGPGSVQRAIGGRYHWTLVRSGDTSWRIRELAFVASWLETF